MLYYDGCDCYDFISDLFLSPTRGDQLHMSYQLLYHIMTLLKSCADKAFELVIDLTQATQYPNVTRCYNETGRYNYTVNAIAILSQVLSLHTNLTSHMKLLGELYY